MFAYASPPIVILGRVLEKALKDHVKRHEQFVIGCGAILNKIYYYTYYYYHPCELVLVAPEWPNQSWYARLLDLLVEFPLLLSLRKDLFQHHNNLRHQSLPAVCLHAWRLSSDPSRRGFSEAASVQSFKVHCQSSLVGVRNRRLFHSKSIFQN